MRIFILNPPYVRNFCRSARWAAISRGRVQRHPDSLLILAAYLENLGHEIGFIDGPVSNLERPEVIARVKNFAPQLLVFHTTTPSIYNDLSYAHEVKKHCPTCITIAIGAHVSAVPENTFSIAARQFENSLDAIATNEFEFSIGEVADNPEKLYEIAGIATYSKQKLNLIDR
ncbi:MAG TPA: cobalamin-dependent protein, partial [Candidatus Rifleibacterium sp.]|nr:cobalamin-dependent protein [Candidatus Rifleibacterium sp.]